MDAIGSRRDEAAHPVEGRPWEEERARRGAVPAPERAHGVPGGWWVRLLALPVAAAALWGLHHLVDRAGLLEVRRIVLEGCERVAPERVRDLLLEQEGTSLLTLNRSRAARRLEAHVPIRSAAVSKRFPHELHVRIRERKPVALVEIQGALCALDTQGVVLYPVRAGDPLLDLPVITGLADRAWVLGAPDRGPTVQASLGLLRALDRSGLPARAVEIRADPEQGVSLVLAGFSAEIRVGWDAFPERLQLLARALPALARSPQGIEFVDLRFDGQVVAQRRVSDREGPVPKSAAAGRGHGAPKVGRRGDGPPRA